MNSPALVTIKVQDVPFVKFIEDYAAAAMRGFRGVFVDECRELAGELTKRTPPFSGALLRKMLDVQDQRRQIEAAMTAYGPFTPKGFNDPEIESLSARKVGERRVEKDIKRVIYGVRGASQTGVFKGQDSHTVHSKSDIVDWGVYQKCQGKDAIRIFATKKGEVYGVDFQRFKAQATTQDMQAVHQAARTKRGRTTTAGMKDRVVGRWRWLDVLVTSEAIRDKYIKFKKKMVGQAKGGWATSFAALGGRISRSGWIGRHALGNGVPVAGRCDMDLSGSNIHVSIINQSAWASGGDPDRVMSSSLAGRSKVLAKKTRNVLEGIWGSKARKQSEHAMKMAA